MIQISLPRTERGGPEEPPLSVRGRCRSGLDYFLRFLSFLPFFSSLAERFASISA